MLDKKNVKFNDDPRMAQSVKDHIETFYNDNPMLEYMGITVTEFGWARVRLDANVKHDVTNVYHIAHGGLAFTLADTAMGGACLGCNKRVVTLDMTMNFIKAVPEGAHIYGVGEVIHNGKHTMVCVANVYDDEGDLVLKSQATFYVLKEFTD